MRMGFSAVPDATKNWIDLTLIILFDAKSDCMLCITWGACIRIYINISYDELSCIR